MIRTVTTASVSSVSWSPQAAVLVSVASVIPVALIVTVCTANHSVAVTVGV